MNSFSINKCHITLLLALCLLGVPALHADETPPTAQPASQLTWGNAFSKALNTTFLLGPTFFNTYQEISRLSSNNQKELIGDKPVRPETHHNIRAIMQEQGFQESHNLEIVAMRDSLYKIQFNDDAALPTPEPVQVQQTFKHNAFGVHMTNACMFIDEDIINFEKKPLLSTFLVRHALKKYKNNHYRNTVFANIALGFAKTAALYKTTPLISQGINTITNSVGWTSLSDPQQSGMLVRAARFAVHNVMCPMIAQSIVQGISSRLFTWYTKSIHQTIDETVIHRDNILPLIVEIAKMIEHFTVKPVLLGQTDTKIGNNFLLACTYNDELCLLANKLFTTSSIIEWINVEIQEQKKENNIFMVTFLESLKKEFFEKNRND